MPITVTTTDGRAYRYDYYFTFGDQLRDAHEERSSLREGLMRFFAGAITSTKSSSFRER